MRLVEIHIFVDEVQKVISVGARRVTQVNDRYLVAVLLCNVAVITHDVTFGIGGEEGHAGGAGVLNTGIEPEGCLADTCGTNHKDMNISCINKCRCVAHTAHHNALRQRIAVFIGGCFMILCLFSPSFRCKRNVLIGLSDFRFCCPSCRTVLTVTNCFGLDAVQVIHIGKQCNAAQHTEHNGSDNNQSCNTRHSSSTSLSSGNNRSSFQSL